MIKRILIGLGGTPFTPIATQRAIELAKRHEAEVTGITVVDINRLERVGPAPIGGGGYARRLGEQRIAETRKRIEESLTAFESACAEAGVTHRVMRETGDPFELMVARSRYNDVIIFGLRSLFDYGVVDEPEDLLTRLVTAGVRPIIASAQKFREIRRVLIGYSGSMESAKAMKRFVQLRLWPDVKLKIVCFGKEAKEAKQLLADAAHYCRTHGFETEVEHFVQSAQGFLIPYATAFKADLIVLGNSARRVLLRKAVGEVTLHTIQKADIPLFLSQ
jgi:nucleotide-binding universal stress UspA family protein